MATLKNLVYPPIVDTAMNSFIRNQPCRIYFEINDYNSFDDINGVQVIVYQLDNSQYVLDYEKYPAHVGWIPKRYIEQDADNLSLYYIELFANCLNCYATEKAFPNNVYYRVQLRFTTNEYDTKAYIQRNWEYNMVGMTFQQYSEQQEYCSEWSTVCLIRGINIPSIAMLDVDDQIITDKDINYRSTVNEITAKLVWRDALDTETILPDNNQYETLQSYQIKVYLVTDMYDVLIKDSGILYPSEVDKSKKQIYWKIPHNFVPKETYKICIDYETSNHYVEKNVLLDQFQILENEDDDELDASIFEAHINNEDGYILLHLQGTFNGNIAIRRSSSETNFTEWNDIKYIPLISNKDELDWYFRDYTIKSGVFYKYAIQRINSNGVRGKMTYVGENEDTYTLMPDFENIFLVRNNKQLNITFNRQVTDFKRVVKESLTETLGSKYPFIRRNSNVGYRQFSISGLISYQADKKHTLVSRDELQRLLLDDIYTDYITEVNNPNYEDSVFLANSFYEAFFEHNTVFAKDSYDNTNYQRGTVLTFNEDDEYSTNSVLGREKIKYKPSTLRDVKLKVAESYKAYNESHRRSELYDVNLERDFREYVMDFLYDNTIKLYKSAEEGNMLVKLTDISFTPNQELNGRVYDFSATVTEVAECTLENCLKYGIYSLGTIKDAIKDYVYKFGSITGTYTPNQNLVTLVQEEECLKEQTQEDFVTYLMDHLAWMRLTFHDKPYHMNISNNEVTIYDSETIDETIVNFPLYGHAFRMTYLTAKGSYSALYFVDTNGQFDLIDSGFIDDDSQEVYETTIYNTYINGISLFDKAYSDLLDHNGDESPETLTEMAIELAEEWLEELDFYEDVGILSITPVTIEKITLEYFARIAKSIQTNIITKQSYNYNCSQLYGYYDYNTNFTNLIRQDIEEIIYDETNQYITKRTDIVDICDLEIQAPKNTVFLIQDVYASRIGVDDTQSYRHLINDTEYLKLSDINVLGEDVSFQNIVVAGKHYYYAPRLESVVETLAEESWNCPVENTLDIDMKNTQITPQIHSNFYSEIPFKVDLEYFYDYRDEEITSLDAVLEHYNYLYSYNNKYYININDIIYECSLTDPGDSENNIPEDITKGIDVHMPITVMLNYTYQTKTTYYRQELE